MLRTGFFIDGQFLAKISASYADIFKRGSIFIPAFCESIESCIQDMTQDRVVTSERHYFKGNMNLTSKTENILKDNFIRDKKTYDVLVSNLFSIHSYPVAYSNGEFQEKCIDTMLAVEIVEAAAEKRIDIAVIITGDTDVLPAVLKCARHSVTTVCLVLDGNKNETVARAIIDNSQFKIKFSVIEAKKNIFVKKQNFIDG